MLMWPAMAPAQDQIQHLKFEVSRAEAVHKKFADGLKHCAVLDGQHFYMEKQKRIMLLSDYSKSIQNLVKDQAFNPEKNGPWTQKDGDDKIAYMTRVAAEEKTYCEMAAKLPALKQKLSELEVQKKN